MSAEVFISYASSDRDRILDLVDLLDAAGVSVWIDQMSIEGATMWSQEIVAAIRNCKVLILAISENSADSENVVKEVALASEGRKRILPVYLASAEIPESMAYQLAGIQRVEFFEGDEEAGQQSVIRALAKLGVTVSEPPPCHPPPHCQIPRHFTHYKKWRDCESPSATNTALRPAHLPMRVLLPSEMPSSFISSFSASIQLLGQSHSALSTQLATRGRHCAKYLWRLR